MKKYLFMFVVILVYYNLSYGWVPSVPHGNYLSGSLAPGSIIIFTGAGTIDMNYNGTPAGTTGSHRWLWDFTYNGTSFNEVTRTSSLTTIHNYSNVGTYKIAVRYIDDGGNLSPTTYIFNITISSESVTRYYYLKDHLGSIKMTVDAIGNVASWNDYDAWGMQLDGRCGNVGEAYDKFKFVGNERDVETGYDHLGDRDYDSRIGRLMSVEPYASKYPSLSTYQYAANNPVLLYDAHGDSLWVKWQTGFWSFLGLGTDHKALYENNKLFENGQEYNGDNSFALASLDALNTINSGAEGNEVISQLQGSILNYTIEKSYNHYIGRHIGWDPKDTQGGIDEYGNRERESFTGLAHELGHGYNFDLAFNGKANWEMESSTQWFRFPTGQSISMLEDYACRIENKIRSEHHLPLRLFYGIYNKQGIGTIPILK